jgi:hypothetical protein
MTAEPAKPGVDPTALTVAQASQLLGISEDMLRADIEAGAPVGADGRINLIQYAAWLNSAPPIEPAGDADGED